MKSGSQRFTLFEMSDAANWMSDQFEKLVNEKHNL